MSRTRNAAASAVLSMAALVSQPVKSLANECSRAWTPGWTQAGIDGRIDAMALFDFDGPGPVAPSLVLSGAFFAVDGDVAPSPVVWDGARVTSLRPPSTFLFDIKGLEPLDLDGAGPLSEQLYARGEFFINGGHFPGGIVRWMRDGWEALGEPGGFDRVVSFCAHDFDGPGPQNAQIVAISDSNPLNGAIQRWDGATWSAVGTNNHFSARAVASVDHDGLGPSPPVLYVQAGNTGVMRLNGDQWISVPGLGETLDSIAVFDLDGPGPMGTSLVGVSNRGVWFASAIRHALAFNGQVWSALGTLRPFGNTSAIVRAVPSPGGDVPQSLLLAFLGSRTQVFRWTEIGSGNRLAGDWEPVSTLNPSFSIRSISGLTYFRARGTGQGPPELLVSGDFNMWTGDRWLSNLAAVEETSWRMPTAFSATPDGEVRAMKSFDVDGEGPRPTELWVGGAFSTVRDLPMAALAAWDGTRWNPAGQFTANPASARRVTSLATFDDDGSGPRPVGLYVAGFFQSIDGGIVNHIARLDAGGYTALGSGFTSTTSTSTAGITAMLVADLDGPGFQRESLLVAGAFDNVDGRPLGRIAAWSGTTWTPMGSGAPNGIIGLAAIPRAGTSPLLLAVTSDGSLARWNGASWQTTLFVFSPRASFARMVDDDGDGPSPAYLLVGGDFDSVGSVSTPQGLARYDGQSWTPVTVSSEHGSPEAAAMLDLDGPGPEPERLVLAGSFSNLSGGTHALAVRTDDGNPGGFALMGGYMYPSNCFAIESFVDRPGTAPAIYLAGLATSVDRFAPTGGLAASYLSRFGCPPCIAFETQPKGRLIYAGATLTLTADLAVPVADATFRWRRNGTPLLDGDGTSGSSSLSLSVADVRMADAGVYDLLVAAPCGQAASAGATVAIVCEADLNADGMVAVGDVFEFLTAYFAGESRADLSHDFRISLGDLFAYLGAYFRGC